MSARKRSKLKKGNLEDERDQKMKIQRTNVANWANLPSDVLSCVVPHLSCLEDFYRLSAVCQSWHNYVASAEKPSLSLKFPLLMVVKEGENEGESSEDEYGEITEFNSNFTFHVCKIKLAGAPYRRCTGTKFGWLLTVGMDFQIQLVHPFSEQRIQLPSCPTFEHLLDPSHLPLFGDLSDSDTCIWKAVLSSKPLENMISGTESSECVVMGIFSDLGILAFAKLKDGVWTRVNTVSHGFEDVIHFKGKFYSIDKKGALYVSDINDEKPRATKIAFSRSTFKFDRYLVESSGHLFLVARRCYTHVRKPRSCKPNCWPYDLMVYKLEECSSEESGYSLKKVNNLGNVAFLLGASSVSLFAPGIKGCFRRNRIFFADDVDIGPPYYMALFDVGNGPDGSFEKYDFSRLSKSGSCPPFWFM